MYRSLLFLGLACFSFQSLRFDGDKQRYLSHSSLDELGKPLQHSIETNGSTEYETKSTKKQIVQLVETKVASQSQNATLLHQKSKLRNPIKLNNTTETTTAVDNKLLNPFRDIKLSLNENCNNTDSKRNYHTQMRYSSHHCVIGKDIPQHEDVRFIARTCKFTNLYYSPQEKKFHYYPSPTEQALLETDNDFKAMLESMTVSLGNIKSKGHQKDKDAVPRETIWRPEVHKNNEQPPEKYAVISNPSNLALLLYQPFYSFNLGHLIWDDVLSLFSMLDIFGLANPNVVPIPFYVEMKGNDPYYRCQRRFPDRWNMCTKMWHRTFPSLLRLETHKSGDILRTGNWLRGMNGVHGGAKISNKTATVNETGWNQMLPDTPLVLIPTVLAGTGRHGQMSCDGDCSIGRASQLYSFRNYLIQNILYPNVMDDSSNQPPPPAGYITFSLPGGSSRPKEVSFFDNIIPIVKELYGEDKVKVVDMAKITLQEEVHLAMNTAVLFANHGGGSATSIFLPRDASVFLYSVGKCKDPIWCDHGKNRFDVVFYESNGYIRPTWIHQNERTNINRIKLLLQKEFQKTIESWSMHGIQLAGSSNQGNTTMS